MAKTRVAILGGGVAGLTTAYNLTKTPELRAQYDVTVYQMGWRLGGKAASGRDRDGRNLEHGLHVWFGYYECAFRMLQEVYAAWRPPAGSALNEWTDAFKPQKHTGIGIEIDGRWSHFSVDFPIKGGLPGDGAPTEALTGALMLLLGWLRDAIFGEAPGWRNEPLDTPPEPIYSPLFLEATRAAFGPGSERRIEAEALAAHASLTAEGGLNAAWMWLAALRADPFGFGGRHLDGVADLLSLLDRAYRAANAGSKDPKIIIIGHALNLFAATVRGCFRDLIVKNRSFESIDDEEASAWLIRHGAEQSIVDTSSLMRILYDISFQYVDGDPAKRNCAAGSGIGGVIRLLATYKGSMMYHVQAGFGEAVISPLYEVLKARGVGFEFFQKVTRLELTKERDQIAKVWLARQAKIKDGKAYEPTEIRNGYVCFPSEPFWSQLEDGEDLSAAGANFESHWLRQPPVAEAALIAGTHFDRVVLAIAMGGYKPLGGDPGICAELVAANARFKAFVDKISITPTLAFQFWSDRSLEDLGWETGKSATVSGPQPLDIWADMSQVLTAEGWAGGPRTLHYFCGSYSTRLYAEPAAEAATPAKAAAEIRQLTIDWLKCSAHAWFPKAGTGTDFDWDVLWDPQGRKGEARIDAQFLRANIDPTECCVACGAGETKHRLYPEESGFTNLTLTGEGTRHGLNATAVEAAVMSGMAASRAICGSPRVIPGFDFLSRKPL